MKITACILSYNLPEATDRLVENMKQMITKPSYDLVVFDNGSDPDKVSKYTTHRIEKNTRMTGGLNHCLQISKNNNSDFVWLLVNDIIFKEPEPLESMMSIMLENTQIGVVHPALSEDTVTHYAFLRKNRNRNVRFIELPMVDIICPFYRKEALNVIDWKYNPELTYGWGIDWESAYLIRKAGFKVGIDNNSCVYHILSELYKNKRDREFKTTTDFYKAATRQFNAYLRKKYGHNWKEKFEKLL